MKTTDFIVRYLFALLFLLYGISKFQAFMPTPPMQPEAAKFISALVATGYLWKIVGVLEVLGGLCLVFNRTVNMGLVLLGPVIVNIVLYLLFLQNKIGVPPILMSIFLIIGTGVLLFNRREEWLRLFNSIGNR